MVDAADTFWDAYDTKFFSDHRWGEAFTAYRIGFYAWELWQPRSVIDIGCAVGLMLRGIHDASNFTAKVVGVEGGPAIERMKEVGTEIPIERITPFDLRHLENVEVLPPFGTSFDLAICTEVGEHLPPACAVPLVQLVTSCSPRVLWSAATPDQGGTQHLNERPLEYWQGLFEDCWYSFNEDRTGDLLNRLGPIASEPWYRRIRVYEAMR
jgi:2-polyprenyl-3-methyl-5-hydroxy-6-metoxy-1,4-benzoquinol methylase